jgi:hypothetical protein
MAAIPPPYPPGLPVPPPGGATGIAPAAPINTFIERFRDVRFDTEHDTYGHLLTQFNPMAPDARTAAQLQSALLQEPDNSARAIVVHWQDPNVPTSAGHVVVLHGFKRYPRSLGGAPTMWDDRDFCWFQDMVETAPPTTFEFNAGALEVAQPTPAVVNLRVYDAPTLEAMYTADPNLIIGPTPGASDAGTMVVQTRNGFPLPFRYVAGLLCVSTNPRNIFEMLYSQIVAEG